MTVKNSNLSNLRSGEKIHDSVLTHIGGRDQVIENLRSEVFNLKAELEPTFDEINQEFENVRSVQTQREMLNKNQLNLQLLQQQAMELENKIGKSTHGVAANSVHES